MYKYNFIDFKCVNTLHHIISVKEIKFCTLFQFWILHIECIRVCPYSADLVVNILPHTSQLYVSSSGVVRRCTCVCLLSAEQVVKILLHTEHLKGFSPVWVRICTFNDTFLANSLLQKSQIYRFATLCVALWRTNHPIFKNSLVHSSHLYALSLIWMKLHGFSPHTSAPLSHSSFLMSPGQNSLANELSKTNSSWWYVNCISLWKKIYIYKKYNYILTSQCNCNLMIPELPHDRATFFLEHFNYMLLRLWQSSVFSLPQVKEKFSLYFTY
jgi:hypothetical protein